MTSGSAEVALVVIDVQKAFDEWEAAGRRRNNPDAVARIADLLSAFRAGGRPIFHIRHEGVRPGSSFLPGGSGYRVKDEARALPGEPVLVKRVNSSFIGTDLEARLRSANIGTLIICGATTNHCVETTTRMAGNLGFDAHLVRDATWTFDRTGPDGELHRADDIHAMTLANLDGEFARIVWSRDVIDRLKGSSIGPKNGSHFSENADAKQKAGAFRSGASTFRADAPTPPASEAGS